MIRPSTFRLTLQNSSKSHACSDNPESGGADTKIGNTHLRSFEPTPQDKGHQKENSFHKF